ncbi:O-antigen ligase [Rhizobium sp. L1K21]|uniref:O-antigen ligase family protein n=1 Tax=Rhizobium sp. L1K21 TaxID=2954933 RepID=UPI002093ACC2|nr:O-antigen ligase family protein [Rhizobium sp. L1K21]
MLVFKKIPAALTRTDLLLAGSATAYVAANLLASALNGMKLVDFAILYPVFVFLFPWFIIPRLRLSTPDDLIGMLALGAGFCCILALPLAIYQSVVLHMRVEGGAGNAIPFGLICAVVGQLALLNTASPVAWRAILGCAGYLAALICLVLSETRGLLPVMLVGPVLVVTLFSDVRKRMANRWFLLAAALALLVLFFISGPIIARLMQFVSFVVSGQQEHSTAERLMLWRHAADLIAERPIFGFGMQHRQELIQQTGFGYSHFHNGFVTALVDSGLVGLLSLIALLAAPVVIAAKAFRAVLGRERLFVALTLVAVYVLGGMTNLIFWHDIYDNLFLWVATIVAASVPATDSNPALGRSEV